MARPRNATCLARSSSPKVSLFNEAEAIATGAEGGASEPEPAPTPAPTKKPRVRSPESGGRDEFPSDLPRTVVVVDVSAEEKICPADGAPLEKIGERIVEKFNIEPARITVTQYVYPSYSCSVCKETVIQAPAVPSALPSSACEPALLAYILAQKYGFGLPLYRIERQLAQLGVTVSRAKMARWVIAAADALGDVDFEIKAHILGQAAIHADETTVQVLKVNVEVLHVDSLHGLRNRSGRLVPARPLPRQGRRGEVSRKVRRPPAHRRFRRLCADR